MRKGIVSLLFLLCLLFSCNKKEIADGQTEADKEGKQKNILQEGRMCYFSHNAPGKKDVKTKSFIREIASFATDRVPKAEFVPWTDAIRVSGVGFIDDEPHFIINKEGILFFNSSGEGTILSYTANSLFPNCTASGFYNSDLGLLVRSYKTSLFEYVGEYSGNEIHSAGEEMPVLNRYNSFTQDVESIIFPHHFALPSYATLTSLVYNNGWFASFKIDSGDVVEFSYFSFNNIADVLSANYTSISADVFRSASSPINEKDARFATLPQGLISLMQNITEENVLIEYFDGHLPSPIKILKTKNATQSFEDADMEAFATVSKMNGKIYYSLLLNNGKLYLYSTEDEIAQIYLLPQMPEGFCYTYFAIYQDVILAGWEEQAFYECGRAGFFMSPIPKLKQPSN